MGKGREDISDGIRISGRLQINGDPLSEILLKINSRNGTDNRENPILPSALRIKPSFTGFTGVGTSFEIFTFIIGNEIGYSLTGGIKPKENKSTKLKNRGRHIFEQLSWL